MTTTNNRNLRSILLLVLSFLLCSCLPTNARRLASALLDNTIIGGVDVEPDQFPFVTTFFSDQICGGALVHDDILVTSATCVATATPFEIYVGAVSSTFTGVNASVCETIVHPNYVAGGDSYPENDIAVLVLCEGVSSVTLAAMNQDTTYPSSTATLVLTGYGDVDTDGTGATTMQTALVDLLPVEDCSKDYFPDLDTETSLCTKKTDGKGLCFGDLGTALMDSDGLLVGIASYFKDCTSMSTPDLYMSVSAYYEWLKQQICQNADVPPGECIPSSSPTMYPTLSPSDVPSPSPSLSLQPSPSPSLSQSPTTTAMPTEGEDEDDDEDTVDIFGILTDIIEFILDLLF